MKQGLLKTLKNQRISLPITTFILLFFSHSVFGSPWMGLRKIRDMFSPTPKTVKAMRRPRTEDEMIAKLAKIEHQIGFSDSETELAVSLSLADIENLMQIDLLQDKAVREAFEAGDTENFKTLLFQHITDYHIDSPLVLRWWDTFDDFSRFTIFDRLGREQLSKVPSDARLFFKWWDEAKLKSQQNRLVVFIKQSMDENGGSLRPLTYYQSGERQNPRFEKPFLNMIFRATRENEDFSHDLQQIFKENSIEVPFDYI